MEYIEKYCKDKNLKLTPVRRKVFELLKDEKSGLGAYRILDLLRVSGFNSQPPVAYRALDFLVEHGFVHKIESQNSFVACREPGGGPPLPPRQNPPGRREAAVPRDEAETSLRFCGWTIPS